MRNAFDDARETEARGIGPIAEFLRQQSTQGRFVFTDKGPLALELQKSVGDALVNVEGRRVLGVEFKVEDENKYNNFYLEMWSNRSRFTPGWMITNRADILLYMFLDKMELHTISMGSLKRWAFGSSGSKTDAGHIFDWPMKPQRKRDQKNDTWGFCVPIETIRQQVGIRTYQRDSDGQWRSNVEIAA